MRGAGYKMTIARPDGIYGAMRKLLLAWVLVSSSALSSVKAAAATPDYDAAAAAVREILSQFVQADTTNPPGNEGRVVALAEKRLKKAGIPYEITEFAPGRKNLVARLHGGGADRPLLLLAHLDVVGTEGQKWTTEPHQVKAK